MSRYALLVALLVMLWATESMAYTIGFDHLTGSNLSAFTSYTENGYTVAATRGQWLEAHVFGSPIPAIVAGPIYNPGESQITVTEGGAQFTFQGLDLTSNVAGGTSYTIAGFLGGVEVLSTSVVISSINTFETFNTSLSDSLKLVDRLTITGTPGSRTTSFNIDNIRAGEALCVGPDPNGCRPVPEPAAILLLGVGLAGIEIWRRRRGEG